MSIIYDALKKVETSWVNDSKTKTDKGPKSKPKLYLLYALMICLGLFIANIFYGWLSQKKPAPNTAESLTGGPAAISSSQPLTQTPALQTSVSVTLPASTPLETTGRQEKDKVSIGFTLNGVFFSGNGGYALINNRVVKEGDKVDGATVVQISLDEVDLEFNGSIIKLSNSTK